MYKLKEMPPVRAMEYITAPPQSYMVAPGQQQIDDLAVRAAIFRTIGGEPHLLVVQRAETDSLPGCWKLPGGGIEDADSSIKDAIYREIKEETGLTAVWTVQEIGHGQRWTRVRQGKLVHFHCVTFLVEVEEVEAFEEGMSKSSGPGEEGETSLIDSKEAINVKLSNAEHQNYAWLPEMSVVAGQSEAFGKMTFTSPDARGVMIDSFRVQRAVMDAKEAMSRQ